MVIREATLLSHLTILEIDTYTQYKCIDVFVNVSSCSVLLCYVFPVKKGTLFTFIRRDVALVYGVVLYICSGRDHSNCPVYPITEEKTSDKKIPSDFKSIPSIQLFSSAVWGPC